MTPNDFLIRLGKQLDYDSDLFACESFPDAKWALVLYESQVTLVKMSQGNNVNVSAKLELNGEPTVEKLQKDYAIT